MQSRPHPNWLRAPLVRLIPLALLLYTNHGYSCSYDAPMPFEEVLENANTIAVVQITSQVLTDKVEFSRPVISGQLRVVEVLLGEPTFDSVEFSNVPCGQVRLDVGIYYMLFTSQTGRTLRLAPADNSMIALAQPVFEEYNPWNPEGARKFRFFRSVLDFIEGKVTADSVDPFPNIERNGTLSRPQVLRICPDPGKL